MKTSFTKLAVALAVAGAAFLSAPAKAITIDNADPGVYTFTGFDWSQGGTAFTTGFVPTAGDTFSLTFFSWAIALQNGINPIITPGLDPIANGAPNSLYEYTVVAILQETVNSCTAPGPGQTCSFTITGGTFDIRYDTAQDANATTGTGFTNGVSIISGILPNQSGGSFNTTDNSNATTIQGIVTSTNNTYVNPNLGGTTAVTTLQIGTGVTNGYVPPAGFNGTPFNAGNIIFQADANQSFTAAVPEPGVIALLGIGLLGLALARRKVS